MQAIEALPLTCPACGAKCTVQLRQIIDLGVSPEVRRILVENKLHDHDCPSCGQLIVTPLPAVIRDPVNERFLIYVPANCEMSDAMGVRMRKLGETLMASVEDPFPPYMAKPIFCNSYPALAHQLIDGFLDDPREVGLRVGPQWSYALKHFPPELRPRLLAVLYTVAGPAELNAQMALQPDLHKAVLAAFEAGKNAAG